MLTTHCNQALCHWKLGEFAECIRECDKVLELDKTNEKCLFRRGQCQMSMAGYDEAIQDFQQVLKLNPNNSAAKQSIRTCREHLKTYEEKEKELYSQIFKKMILNNN